MFGTRADLACWEPRTLRGQSLRCQRGNERGDCAQAGDESIMPVDNWD
jgi:hypothetical protein